MSKLLSLFETNKRTKLREAATQLRNSEFKHESVDYVMSLLTSGYPIDDASRF